MSTVLLSNAFLDKYGPSEHAQEAGGQRNTACLHEVGGGGGGLGQVQGAPRDDPDSNESNLLATVASSHTVLHMDAGAGTNIHTDRSIATDTRADYRGVTACSVTPFCALVVLNRPIQARTLAHLWRRCRLQVFVHPFRVYVCADVGVLVG